MKLFMVTESCEDYEQCLGIVKGAGLPEKGILAWKDNKTVFPTRKEARDAIIRTDHYRLAFDESGHPAKKDCKIYRVSVA